MSDFFIIVVVWSVEYLWNCGTIHSTVKIFVVVKNVEIACTLNSNKSEDLFPALLFDNFLFSFFCVCVKLNLLFSLNQNNENEIITIIENKDIIMLSVLKITIHIENYLVWFSSTSSLHAIAMCITRYTLHSHSHSILMHYITYVCYVHEVCLDTSLSIPVEHSIFLVVNFLLPLLVSPL